MVIKSNMFLFSVLFFSLFSLTLSFRFDPQQCQQKCYQQEQSPYDVEDERCYERCQLQHQQQDPRRQYQRCHQECQEEQSPDRKSRCQQGCQEQFEEQLQHHDPQRQYDQCLRECHEEQIQQQQQQLRARCEESCQEKMKQKQQQQKRCQQKCQQQQQSPEQQRRCEQSCQEGQQKQGNKQNNNPYFFDGESFTETFKSEQGSARVLKRFSRDSNFLGMIDNYRMAILEASPNTFVTPSHFDAEAIFYVVRGNGVITLIQQEQKHTYNIQHGDVIRVPAGSMIYLINKDNRETLSVAQFWKPVLNPARYRDFSAVGKKTYYRAFSSDVLQAALNAPSKRLEGLFGQQKQARIIKASQEQIRALSRQASQGGHHAPWGGSQSSAPYNLLNKQPLQSNRLGKLYQVNQDDYKQLQDLDVFVSFTNITKGAMMAPHYNSRATVAVLVVEGSGRFQMVSPYISDQSQSGGREKQQKQQQGEEKHERRQEQQPEEQEQEQDHYQRVSSHISKQTVFVIPAGHPSTVIADDSENLQLVAFGVNAENNQMNYLAGKNNMLNQMENDAKELAFNRPAREVDSIINNQDNQYFLPGPNLQQQRQEGRHELPFNSIIDFAHF